MSIAYKYPVVLHSRSDDPGRLRYGHEILGTHRSTQELDIPIRFALGFGWTDGPQQSGDGQTAHSHRSESHEHLSQRNPPGSDDHSE